jgi:hypothetical protein
MAMMLITTSNSISVKADRHRLGNIIHRLLARLCLDGSKIMGVTVKGVKRGQRLRLEGKSRQGANLCGAHQSVAT